MSPRFDDHIHRSQAEGKKSTERRYGRVKTYTHTQICRQIIEILFVHHTKLFIQLNRMCDVFNFDRQFINLTITVNNQLRTNTARFKSYENRRQRRFYG